MLYLEQCAQDCAHAARVVELAESEMKSTTLTYIWALAEKFASVAEHAVDPHARRLFALTATVIRAHDSTALIHILHNLYEPGKSCGDKFGYWVLSCILDAFRRWTEDAFSEACALVQRGVRHVNEIAMEDSKDV